MQLLIEIVAGCISYLQALVMVPVSIQVSAFLSVSHLYMISAYVTQSQVFPHIDSGSHLKIGLDILYLGHIESSASKPGRNQEAYF